MCHIKLDGGSNIHLSGSPLFFPYYLSLWTLEIEVFGAYKLGFLLIDVKPMLEDLFMFVF